MNRVALTFIVGVIFASLFVIHLVSQWELPQIASEETTGQEWVLLQPTKCTEIPWRKEWTYQTNRPYAEFPLAQEKNYLRDYYVSRNIPIYDVSLTYEPSENLCTQCGCPESFVFAVKVNARDAARLAVSGFQILSNDDPSIFTAKLFRQSTEKPISYVSSQDCANVFATNTFVDAVFGSKKDSCYIQAAISERNIEVCDNASSTNARNTCITEVAVVLKYPDACNRLTAQARDSCLAGVAGQLRTPETCAQISDATTKEFCYLGARGN